MLRIYGARGALNGSRFARMCNSAYLRMKPAPRLFSTEGGYADKSILSSFLANDKWVVFPDGSSYSGKCLDNGVMHGEGKYVSANGSIYTGTFDNGVFSGPGQVALADGCLLRGTFSNSQLHGYGVVSVSNKKHLYGYFQDGRLFRGSGEMPLKLGGSYTGTWRAGKWHGPGKLVYPDDRILQGKFKEGKIYSGQGVVGVDNGNVVLSQEVSETAAPTVSLATSEIGADEACSVGTDATISIVTNNGSEINEPVWWRAPEKADRNNFIFAINQILGHTGESETVFASYFLSLFLFSLRRLNIMFVSVFMHF